MTPVPRQSIAGFTIDGGGGRTYCANCTVDDGVCPNCGLYWYVDPSLPGTGRAAIDTRDLDPRVFMCPSCGTLLPSGGCKDEWHREFTGQRGFRPVRVV